VPNYNQSRAQSKQDSIINLLLIQGPAPGGNKTQQKVINGADNYQRDTG
jgi:hypothetical protein